MNPLVGIGYEAVAQLARALAALTPPSESKLLRSLRARRGIRGRFVAWGHTGRDAARRLVWMHAPSVGEGLQARPVVELLRAQRPELQIAYTHFSPSAAVFAATLPVDFRDYLPFDTRRDAAIAVDSLRPAALIFSKLDVWPVLSRVASERRVRLGLISATVAAGSSRRRGFSAELVRDAYRRLDAVGAISDEDAGRLLDLGVRPDVLSVTGDTRYDQVWTRASLADRAGPLLAPLASDRPTLVAGSTWPADERMLLPAWERVHAAHPRARLVIAPHEPTAAHLRPIERWGAERRIGVARLSAADPESPVVLVDRVGVLGDLYALADASYVGGGFHAAGLHSVLEPAAYGSPVLFGPRHHGSRDAGLLIAAGGAVEAGSTEALSAAIDRWFTDPAARLAAGVHARATVERGLGAGRRSLELVTRLLEQAV